MNQAAADDEKLKKIFAAHPLSVELQIALDADSTIKLSFSHISVMNVVAVKTTLALSGEDAAASDKEVLAPSAVFAHLHAATRKSDDGGGSEELYLADSGSVSPNPATDHLLRR